MKSKRETNVVCIYMGRQKAPGGCEIYRGNLPLHYLGEHPGWNTAWRWFGDLWDDYTRNGAAAWLRLVEDHDLFVFPRVYFNDDLAAQALGGFFQILRDAGKKIVYEVDDDYSNQYRKVIDGDAITPIQWADAVTVTTPLLKKRMQRYTQRPIHILPNCVSPSDFFEGEAPERTPEMADKLIVALTGSQTHAGDWRVLQTVMPRILEENSNIHFLLMGYLPDYLRGLPQTTELPGMPYDQYAQILRGCDVILAPVDPEDQFNLGKSPIKAIEGMAARRELPHVRHGGAAVIATGNPVYRLAVKHEKTGLLVQHTPDAWYKALTRLIRDEDLRLQLQLQGHRWVQKHHDISKAWRHWARAYRRILAAPSNSTPIHLPN